MYDNAPLAPGLAAPAMPPETAEMLWRGHSQLAHAYGHEAQRALVRQRDYLRLAQGYREQIPQERLPRLTAGQHAAYLWLLMDDWSNGAPPADDAVLARIARLERASWDRHKPVLLEFFTEVEDRLLHACLEELKGEAESNRLAVSVRGTRVAQARWNKQTRPQTSSGARPCTSNA